MQAQKQYHDLKICTGAKISEEKKQNGRNSN